MSSNLPTVALVVVAYQHAAHLPATLDALQRLDYPTDRLTIVAVDNGDGSSAQAARNWEQAQPTAHAPLVVIEPARNLGFAGGCNAGVIATNSAIVALINPDLVPLPTFLTALIAPLDDPQVGITGAKLLYPDRRTIQHAGGFVQRPLLLAQHNGYGEPDRGQYDQPRDVEFVTGAALALRRATWDALGGLDETFWPAYYEDVDLAWHARDHGLRVRYEPRAVAMHHEAAGVGIASAQYHRLYHTNRLRLLFKHTHDHALLHTWLPAEFAHLRATAADNEIAGLLAAYLHWQAVFLHEHQPAPMEQPPIPPGQTATELEWGLQQIARKRTIAPLPFRSRWPLVARARTWLSRIVTEEYLRPLIQQQNDYNATVAELAVALARQRRATDAAIACQAMLLAKQIHRSANNANDRE